MAEICLECFNKEENTNFKEKDVVLDYDLCESCGEWKPCVIVVKKKGFFRRLKDKIWHSK